MNLSACRMAVLGFSLPLAVALRAAEGPVTLSLKPSPIDPKQRPMSFRGCQVDADGMGRIQPFANAPGYILFQVSGETVRFDTDGDGKLGKGDAPAVKGSMTTVKVTAKFKGAPYDYPLVVLFARKDMIAVGSPAQAEGTWGDRTVVIGDGNLDGVFGGSGDRIRIAKKGAAESDGPASWQPWTRMLNLDGNLHSFALNDRGELRIEPYTGPVSELRISSEPAPTGGSLMLMEQSSGYVATISSLGGPIRAVPGQYQLRGQVNWGAGGPAMYLSGFASPIEIGKEPKTVRIGPPLTVDFEAVRDGDKVAVSKVAIRGVSGEAWRPIGAGEDNSPAAFVRAGGKEERLAKMEYG